MAYDPYAYQDPYGGYDQYETFEDSPPPEPRKDWENVPKLNRSYARKIRGNIVQEDFIHLNTEKLYVVEVMVEHIELNEELMVKDESKEKAVDEIITRLKVLHLPFSELSVSRDGKRLDTEINDQSLTSLITYPPLPEFFQRIFSHAEKLANVSEDEGEDQSEALHLEEHDKNDEGKDEIIPPLNEDNEEELVEETTKRVKIDVMGGKSVLLLMSGVAMVQKLQTHSIRIAASRRYVTEAGEDELPSEETIPLGAATVRLPRSFQKTVLRRSAIKDYFSTPLVGEDGEEIGEARLIVSLVSLGQGVAAAISEGPRVYGKVELIKAFLPEPTEYIFDPMVHPRLAVTLMNMEPPLDLCRTSTEILQNCLDFKLITSEGDDGALYSKIKRRKCRWMEIAKEVKSKYSKFSLNSRYSDTRELSQRRSTTVSRLRLQCPGQESNPELDLLFRKLKRQCREHWEEKELKDKEKNPLYDELEELLRHDKGEGWESEDKSEHSEKSLEEGRVSKSSRVSSIKSTLKSVSQYN